MATPADVVKRVGDSRGVWHAGPGIRRTGVDGLIGAVRDGLDGADRTRSRVVGEPRERDTPGRRDGLPGARVVEVAVAGPGAFGRAHPGTHGIRLAG